MARGLGRGLSALMGEEDAPARKDAAAGPIEVTEMPVEFLEPNPYQPRRIFSEDDLKDLTASVKERGVIQPIIVRPKPGVAGRYQIIAGERRWRAAQRAQLHNVPVRVKELDDSQALEIAIVENVQRTDLNAIEEALGYRQLMDEFSYTQDALAKYIGKSRPHIANTLRLLGLPEAVQVMLADGRLSAGHARAIMMSPEVAQLAKQVIAEGLSVRQAEALAKDGGDVGAKSKSKGKTPAPKDADTRALEKRLMDALGLKVEISHKGEAGKVTLSYSTLEQLDDIAKRLAR